MAETTVQTNNKPVAYRRKAIREKPRMASSGGLGVSPLAASDGDMPVVSKAQNAAMHAAASGNSTIGIPQSVGQEFTSDQAPGSVKKLPQRVKPKKAKAKRTAHKSLHKRGLISNSKQSKHFGIGETETTPIDAATR